MTWAKVIGFIARLLGALLPVISPEIKKLFEDSLRELYKRALATPNPIDDVFAKALCDLMGVNVSVV